MSLYPIVELKNPIIMIYTIIGHKYFLLVTFGPLVYLCGQKPKRYVVIDFFLSEYTFMTAF
jgi:hypothetical protein